MKMNSEQYILEEQEINKTDLIVPSPGRYGEDGDHEYGADTYKTKTVIKIPLAQSGNKSTGDTGDTGDRLEIKGVSSPPVNKNITGTAGTSFFSNDKGVWFRPDGEDQQPIWICSPLCISALTRTPEGEAWGRLLEFPDPDGRLHKWACPLESLAGDGVEFRKILLSLGLRIAPGGRARQLLANYVQTAQVETRATCTDKPGWHNSSFVLADETIGQPDGEEVLLQTIGEPMRMRQSGTLEEWRENVGKYCAGNSRLVVGVSNAFAGPLLNITGDESGGIHFVGSSSNGKTTVLRAAASAWGGPEFLHRWRATANGLESLAQAHNDGFLILDEIAQVDPREAGEIAYMLANGTGKHRSRRDGLAKKAASWRLLFLSAGEIGLADHMLQAGRRFRAGQEVRLVDIPSDAGKGNGIFEDLHGFSSGAHLADHLNQQVGKYYGIAVRAFLRLLVQTQTDMLKKNIKELRDDFLASKVPCGADGQTRRVASRFALIAAAGEIASRFGITGWKPGIAIEGASICFDAWLDRRGGTGSQEEGAALAQVKYFLEAHGEARFTDFDKQTERPTINRAGYRRITEDGVEYLILPEVFRRDVCSGLDYRIVARTLQARDLLRTEPGRLTIKMRGIGRVYCIKENRDEG